MKDTQNYVPLNRYLHYANQFKINNLRKNLSLAIIDFVTKKKIPLIVFVLSRGARSQ